MKIEPATGTPARTAECNAANWGWRVAGIKYTWAISVTPKFNGDVEGYMSFGITPGCASSDARMRGSRPPGR